MPRHAIGDSTVFYDIGEGKKDLAEIIRPGEQLHYSPVTIVEIAAKVTEETFPKCKAAAKAIIDSSAKLLLDTQSHLTRLFGFELAKDPFDWSNAVKAIVQAPTVAALASGVIDRHEMVRRRVIISEALHWRETTYEMWHDELIVLMRDKIPTFGAWWDALPERRSKKVPKIKKKEQESVLKDLRSKSLLGELILACHTRSFYGAVKPDVENLPPELIAHLHDAIDNIDCYCKTYIEYVIRLLTEGMLPQPNDGGDLELFLYLTDDDHVLVTSDKRWLRLADRAGYKHRVRKV
jgi:hypothetical protein